ncbi:hypothetical protein [Caballeronia sp. TF1N1]|uniref:hypothetical protein n=1 Tax=Caballeronia sp. TF1N1 TaxID=2878153 RepID=UPI001FD58B81|nr:hypothetical protein [Caballeronia sp. TF1N1]
MKNDEQSTAATKDAPSLIAWHVTERGGKSFWTRIGAAWPHTDEAGCTVQLDLMPISGGRIILRARSEEQDQQQAD